MKELSKFLKEQEEQEEIRPLGEDEGADDKEFFELMSQYKQLRRKDRKAADNILAQAQKLSQKGDVSDKIKLAAAYL